MISESPDGALLKSLSVQSIEEALAYAHKLRLAGVSFEHQLSQTLAYLRGLIRENDDRKSDSQK